MVRRFKMMIRDVYQFLGSYWAYLYLKRKYPTCIFYPGVGVDAKTNLGDYIVLFRNVNVYKSAIKDHTFVQSGSTINCAVIGKFCSIASGVHIGLGQHPLKWVSTHPAFYSKTQPIAVTFAEKDEFEPFQKTVIGHDVWIGRNALIRDGVKVGTGAVIAAGAVVVNDVEPYAVVGGVPAKAMQFRFDPSLVQKLLDTQWWDMPFEWLRANHHLLSRPEEFVALLQAGNIKRNDGEQAKE